MRQLLCVALLVCAAVGCGDSGPSKPAAPNPADTKTGKGNPGVAKIDKMD